MRLLAAIILPLVLAAAAPAAEEPSALAANGDFAGAAAGFRRAYNCRPATKAK